MDHSPGIENMGPHNDSEVSNQPSTSKISDSNSRKRYASVLVDNRADSSPRKIRAVQPESQSRCKVSGVAGRVKSIELENFMCHGNLKVDLDVVNNNCFYIGGPNGSGKSALFAALNIGLGGRGNNNDRGNTVKQYIKEGKQRAKITIVLTNTGDRRVARYDHLIVVERTITPSASTYTLKSRSNSGKTGVISKKKGDLDVILDQLGIQLDNPIYWMSQDRSRQFLHKMDPYKMFQIFWKGTSLEQTEDYYRNCERVKKNIESGLKDFKKTLSRKKEHYQKLVALRKRFKAQKCHREEISRLGFYLNWAPVRDLEKDRELYHIKVKKIDEESTRLKQLMHATSEEMTDNQKKTEEIREILEEYKLGMDELVEKRNEAEDRMKTAVLAKNKAKAEIGTKKDEHKEIKRQITKAGKNMDEILRKLNSQEVVNKINAVKKRLEDLNHQEGELQRMKVNLRNDKRTAIAEKDHALEEFDQCSRKERELKNRVYEAKREITEAENTAANRLARFGRIIPRIVDIIKANERQFSHTPKGPIGDFLSVDPKWAIPVEELLKQHLDSFVFHSRQDEKIFIDLLRRQNIRPPKTIIFKFDVQPYNVSRNEPTSEWLTVNRALTVSDHVIRNILIDSCRIESVLLFERKQEACRLMDGNCPEGATRGFCSDGSTIFGNNRTTLKAQQYRVYASDRRPNCPIVLGNDSTFDIEGARRGIMEMENELAHLHGLLARKANEKASMSLRISNFEKSELDLDRKFSALQEIIRRSMKELSDLEAQADFDGNAQLDKIQASIDLLKMKLTDVEEEMDNLAKKHEGVDPAVAVTAAEVKEVSDQIVALNNEAQPYKEDLDALLEKKKKLHCELERIKSTQRETDGLIETMETNERIPLEERLETAKAEALKFSGPIPAGEVSPPDFSKLPDTASLREELLKKTQLVEEMDAILPPESVPSDAEILKVSETYKEGVERYKQMWDLLKEFDSIIDTRLKTFPMIQALICDRLQNAFGRLIRQRYQGNLNVCLDSKQIRLKMKPNGDPNAAIVEPSAKKLRVGTKDDASQDLKGLSGGERSYLTACFVMSLWEIMEAPFRCMDEFDVFMDMINRKVVMGLLVDLATEQYPNHQFIFFTPQGIKELGSRDRVQIFEMPRVRDV